MDVNLPGGWRECVAAGDSGSCSVVGVKVFCPTRYVLRKNKGSDKGRGSVTSVLLGNYDRPTNQSTKDQKTDIWGL